MSWWEQLILSLLAVAAISVLALKVTLIILRHEEKRFQQTRRDLFGDRPWFHEDD